MYLQRQVTAFVGNNNYTDPVRYGIGDRVWSSQDIYPAKIMVIGNGDVTFNEILVPAATEYLLPITAGYSSVQKFSIFLKTNTTVKITVAKPALPSSVTLVRAGTSSDSPGVFSYTGLTTSILVSNTGTTPPSALIEYIIWAYPADINAASAWRDGAQTIGTVPST